MSETDDTDVTEIENNKIVGCPQKSLVFRPQKKTDLPNISTSPLGNHESKYDMKHDKEVSLQKELDTVRSMNEVVEKVLSSLESAQGNIALDGSNSMKTVLQTVNSASTLLDAWVKILSYTEHNQRLITNPNWKGASADIAIIENESILKAQAEEKRLLEAERRKEEAKRVEEEEERRRQVGNPLRGSRGALRRAGGAKRGYSSSSLNTIGRLSGTQNSGRGIPVARAGSGIGRGIGSSRGRPRGTR
ncbi:DASH complex subunit Duo1 [Erysiphe neolycopersici]|uniref:DASH complex subunit DUO1 n=1 Tax=Erysiphe neolycopersici TaxID=212602 RepID=A0A420HXN2_9PEZI|nr:DASH complex subunit Duo1 [Erysiphe neolycopersici]